MKIIGRLADWLNPKVMMAVWLLFSVVWAVLLYPSLVYWSESVKWIVVMSWWANLAASVACFIAAHGDDNCVTKEDVAELRKELATLRGMAEATYAGVNITNNTLDDGLYVWFPEDYEEDNNGESGV